MVEGPPDLGWPEPGRPKRDAERDAAGVAARDAARRAGDWITIWQSELAALATDPELQESWVRQVDLWAETAQRAVRALAGGADAGAAAGTAAAPGAPADLAASGARDAAIDRLAQRVAELERQLGQRGPRDPELPAGPSRT